MAISLERIAKLAESLPVAPQEIETPTLLGRYRLEEQINEGGMGVVYLATQLQLNRKVAIKLIHPEVDGDPAELARRFCLEAATLAKITHPNIVTIHDYGQTEDGDLFIAMEYLQGRSLAEELATGRPLSFGLQLRITIEITRALREAHRLGVVHRDLKPANVMLAQGADEEDHHHVKLLDFGLAKVHPKIPGLDTTRPRAVVGSPRYMAPEQICGEPIDIRSDIYSLGAIMFTMAAGTPPFDGASATEIVRSQLRDPAPPIASVGLKRSYPEAYESLILRCLEKRPEDRYQSIQELLAQLKVVSRMVPSGESAIDPLDSGSLPHVFDYETPPPNALQPIAPEDLRYAADLAEATIRELSGSKIERPKAHRARIPIALAVSALWMIGVAFFALRTAETPAAAPQAVANESRVTFRSTPSGAEVFERETSLGITPFVRRFPKDPTGSARNFIFRLPGYQEISSSAGLLKDEVELLVGLSPLVKEAPLLKRRSVSAHGRKSHAARAPKRAASVREPAPAVKPALDQAAVPTIDDGPSAVPTIEDGAAEVPTLDDEAVLLE